jgi:hypothetical protein
MTDYNANSPSSDCGTRDRARDVDSVAHRQNVELAGVRVLLILRSRWICLVI